MEEKNKEEETKANLTYLIIVSIPGAIGLIYLTNQNSINSFFSNLSFDILFTLLVHLLIIVGLVAMVIFMAKNHKS